jgi:hypothetical protein
MIDYKPPIVRTSNTSSNITYSDRGSFFHDFFVFYYFLKMACISESAYRYHVVQPRDLKENPKIFTTCSKVENQRAIEVYPTLLNPPEEKYEKNSFSSSSSPYPFTSSSSQKSQTLFPISVSSLYSSSYVQRDLFRTIPLELIQKEEEIEKERELTEKEVETLKKEKEEGSKYLEQKRFNLVLEGKLEKEAINFVHSGDIALEGRIRTINNIERKVSPYDLVIIRNKREQYERYLKEKNENNCDNMNYYNNNSSIYDSNIKRNETFSSKYPNIPSSFSSGYLHTKTIFPSEVSLDKDLNQMKVTELRSKDWERYMNDVSLSNVLENSKNNENFSWRSEMKKTTLEGIPPVSSLLSPSDMKRLSKGKSNLKRKTDKFKSKHRKKVLISSAEEFNKSKKGQYQEKGKEAYSEQEESKNENNEEDGKINSVRAYMPMKTRISQKVLNTFYDVDGGTGTPVRDAMVKNTKRSLSGLTCVDNSNNFDYLNDLNEERIDNRKENESTTFPSSSGRSKVLSQKGAKLKTKRRQEKAYRDRYVEELPQSTMPYGFIKTSPLFKASVTSNSPFLHPIPYGRVGDTFSPSSSLYASNLMLSAKFTSAALAEEKIASQAPKKQTAEEIILNSLDETIKTTDSLSVPVHSPLSPSLSPKSQQKPGKSNRSTKSTVRPTIEAESYMGAISTTNMYRDSNRRMREALGEDTELTDEINPKVNNKIVEKDGLAGVYILILFFIIC